MGKIRLRTIIEFRNGNKEAFEEIFYAYKDALYYVSYFYVKNYDDANDCVQEIFIRLIDKIHLYNENQSKFDSWFFSLAKSTILNFVRAKAIYRRLVTIDDEAVDSYIDKDHREIELILIDLEDIMGYDMFIVYLLRTAYNMSFEKISKLTVLSRETARRLYYESIKIVNEYMGDNYNEKNKKT